MEDEVCVSAEGKVFTEVVSVVEDMRDEYDEDEGGMQGGIVDFKRLNINTATKEICGTVDELISLGDELSYRKDKGHVNIDGFLDTLETVVDENIND